MRVSRDLIAREVAGEYLLIPAGEAALEMKGLFALSESGHFLFEQLQKDCTQEELVQAMLTEYDAPEATVRQDVADFLQQMRRAHMLEDSE